MQYANARFDYSNSEKEVTHELSMGLFTNHGWFETQLGAFCLARDDFGNLRYNSMNLIMVAPMDGAHRCRLLKVICL